jgi:cytochrome P450
MARAGHRRMKLDLALLGLPPLGPGAALARRSWFGLAEQLYEEARNDKGLAQRVDLLGIWLRHGSKLKPSAFRHAMANIFYGGVFSVTSVLVSCFYLLAHDPATEDRLRAEVRDLMKRNPDFDRAALDECVYLDAVLRESMRSCPPVPLYFRNVIPDRAIEFAGHNIPADTLVFITNWFLHRESAYWENPGQFDPGRWQGGGKERDPLGSGYFFPFGRGPRTCLGMPFALFFMKLALATIMGESRIELDRSLPYIQGFFFGVMMPRGLKGHFRPGVVSNVVARGASLSA